MKTSPAGLLFLMREEGCPLNPDGTLKVYNDAKGFATVGVGRLLHRSPFTAADVASWRGKTYKDAVALLRSDIVGYEDSVNRLGLKLNQNQFDALVSFAYNEGVGALPQSELYGYLKGGGRSPAMVAALFHHYDDVNRILRGRRQAEADLFNTPVKPVKKVVQKVVPPYFQWVAWRLGEGAFKGAGAASAKARPTTWAARVPGSYFPRLAAFLARRRQP